MTRYDGRQNNQIRQHKAKQGILFGADGSARFSFDKVSALAAVHGPMETRQYVVETTLQVRVIASTGSLVSPSTMALSGTIRRIFANVIHMSYQKRSEIHVAVSLESNMQEFALISSAINAVMMALLDAGIACLATVASVVIGVNKAGELVIDPGSEERNEMRSVHTFVYDNKGREHMALSGGTFTDGELRGCANAAKLGCEMVLSFMRKAVSHKLDRDKLCLR